jgi:hypothetical protein
MKKYRIKTYYNRGKKSYEVWCRKFIIWRPLRSDGRVTTFAEMSDAILLVRNILQFKYLSRDHFITHQ